MTQNKNDRYYSRKTFRIVSLLFGIFLSAIGVIVLLDNVWEFGWRMLAGFILVFLGVATILSAYRGKEPWLAKLGPLP